MPSSVIAGVALLVLSGAYWMGSNMIAQSSMSGSVGADGLPKLLAIVLAVLSVILIVQSLVMRRLAAASQEVAKEVAVEEGGEVDEFTRRGHVLAVILLAITIVYSLILPYAGYAVSIGFLLLAVALFYGRRPSVGLFAFVAIGAGCFHLIFVTLLGVRMPVGIWPSLFQ
jgi:preprotein translocase subunit SecG